MSSMIKMYIYYGYCTQGCEKLHNASYKIALKEPDHCFTYMYEIWDTCATLQDAGAMS